MFKIAKNKPDFFEKAKSKVKLPKTSSAWNDEEIKKIRPKLREYILLEEQDLLCAYCEKSIDDNRKNSNIDHFKTRNLFPQNTLDYDNLLVSCNTKDRCSYYKDKNIKSKDYNNIVNPIAENPDDFFDYLITGRILAKNNNAKAKFTIDIFQLDITSLRELRKKLAKSLELEYIKNLSLNEIYEIMGNEFCSFIKVIYEKLNQKK